jgi:hypothetical protein
LFVCVINRRKLNIMFTTYSWNGWTFNFSCVAATPGANVMLPGTPASIQMQAINPHDAATPGTPVASVEVLSFADADITAAGGNAEFLNGKVIPAMNTLVASTVTAYNAAPAPTPVVTPPVVGAVVEAFFQFLQATPSILAWGVTADVPAVIYDPNH